MPFLPWLLLVVCMALASGCAVNPATGRDDFVLMDEATEQELGIRYNQDVQQRYPRYPDAQLQAYVQQVGERVARYSHRPDRVFIFTVIDSPDLNAFALPGGYIYVHRGLLAYLGSEAELAAVLAHEIGHVTARHGARQRSQSQAWGAIGQVAALGTGVGAVADATQLLGGALVRGYGREMELQADELGLQYLARSGYDPQAMVRVVEVLQAQGAFLRSGRADPDRKDGGYHGLFDSHPAHEVRLRQLMGREAGSGVWNRDAYFQALDGLVVGESAAQGVLRGRRFYHRSLGVALDIPPGWRVVDESMAVTAYSADGAVFLVLRSEPLEPGLSPIALLGTRVGGRRLLEARALEEAALPGATAWLTGPPARRVAVAIGESYAYLFVAGAMKEEALRNADAQVLACIRSLRGMTEQDASFAEPARIRTLRVGNGQHLTDFISAGTATVSTHEQENRIRLLNNLYPIGDVQPGDWLKVVR
ncbi:M48 family metalloprotease [Metapseudomonas otitidis]|uniref:M48 family metalloprotease n=1 Tax=Metapseudomonas otitidis TaxID=319939 RepID=UPI0013F5F8A2|nr:M48 family metalloprotease [Pseudomonas otitidis]